MLVWCSGKWLSKSFSWPLALAIKVGHFTHHHSDGSVHQRLGLLPKTQLGSHQQNASPPPPPPHPHTHQLKLLTTTEKYPHKRSHEVGLSVNLVCLVLFWSQGQCCVGRMSEPHLELRMDAFHWTYPEKVSACEGLLVWDGEYDLRPQSHYSFCECPLWHHHCKIKLFESIQGKVFDW